MVDVLKRNNVSIEGSGDTALLFVHGYGCDQNMWRYVWPELAKDYKIVLLDLVGAGNSDTSAFNPTKYSSLHGYAEDILEVIEVLNLKDLVYIGHSVSSMIGVLAAIKMPQFFSKLILIGPSPCYINHKNYTGGFESKDIDDLLRVMESNYLGWSADMAPAIMGNPDKPELGKELENSFCKNDPDIAKVFARTTFLSDNRSDLPKVQKPCLILQCSEDIIAPEYVGQYVHEKIPNSTFVKMDATGHCPHLSAPSETLKHIRSFLNETHN